MRAVPATKRLQNGRRHDQPARLLSDIRADPAVDAAINADISNGLRDLTAE
jgi:hypothetical protein